MSVSSSEILCLGVGVKHILNFSISIPCFVKNMWDKLITFGDMLSVVVHNGVDSLLGE